MDPVLLRLVALTASIDIPSVVPPRLHPTEEAHEVEHAHEGAEDVWLPKRALHCFPGNMALLIQSAEQRDSSASAVFLSQLTDRVVRAASLQLAATMARLEQPAVRIQGSLMRV